MPCYTDESFVRMVRRLAKKGSNRLIENASIGHALVIVECLLDEAKKHKEDVHIISGCLMEDFYAKLVNKAREVIDAGGNVSVVVLGAERTNLQDNAFYKAVHNYKGRGRVHIVRDDERAPHFVVTGGKRYRLEVDDEKKKAMASFNDPVNGRLLVQIHEDLIRKAA